MLERYGFFTAIFITIILFLGYSSITTAIPEIQHETVNHSKEFVAVSSSSTKITTNTLEGTHGLLKTKARRLNLFVGQPSKQKAFNDKISELVYRFNHRIYSEDFFLLFLNILTAYYPCCKEDDVEARINKISLYP